MAEVVIEHSSQKSMRRRRFKVEAGLIFCTLILAALLIVIVYPLGLLVINSFIVTLPDGTEQIGFGNWTMALFQAGLLESIVNTFNRVIVTTILVFPIGIFISWLITRTDLPGKEYLDFFMWLAFFLPTLPILMGWILLLEPDFGLINQIITSWFGLEKGPFNIYSFWGIVWAHIVIRGVAATYIFLTPAFRNLDSSYEEASRISGRSIMGTILRIVVPVMTPAILITLIISLIHSLESFEIEKVLGGPTGFYVFSTKIYELISEAQPQFGAATVLSLVILVAMLPLILFQQYFNSRKRFTTVTSHFKRNIVRLGTMKWPAFIFVFGFSFFVTVVPIIFMVMGTFMNLFGFFDIEKVWTLDHWKRILQDPILIKSLWNTVILAGSAALIGMVLYTLLAYISVRSKYIGRGIIDFLTWLPAAIPGIILGLGLLWMFLGTPVFRPLYGTIFILIIAVLINSMTTGVQLIKSNMVQLGSELEEASSISGGSWLYTFRRIIMPILAPVLLSVGTLTFISASRNVANIAMIVTGENRPIAMLQLDYMVDGNYEAAGIAGVFVVILTIGVALIAKWLGKRMGIRI
ncbi:MULTISPECIES: iron ABC transporter permease [unclassified Paenibacillus]|uniref:ABC transporter permease n=1 Tax=unclassified Paenibacillus TaxID=185978 RepID=UPI001AE86B42|nr:MULTISPECIES: iron ABC transporter permease [unclassified Paenibacillus]MBP1154063.1 iron(III) transport system permease protein [Paenibacillus sp. PvP091]MBP1170552.1 iron(III) transport system permease protein [Paenibacillus sp. PvR098]MBP2441580.1 iron(III) transport system permease protein [Paenibacillus sp. PvP052]